jgi:hypothetical protein
MSNELQRSADLIERLLGDPQLRRRFRTDAAGVLTEAGLPELATGLGHGRRALMTLELRESRSSLAGVMVAAAAEGVDFAHFAEHAAPALAHDAGHAVEHLVDKPKHPAAPAPAHVAKPAATAPKPDFTQPNMTPSLAPKQTPPAAPAAPAPASGSAPAPVATTPADAAPTAAPAAGPPAHAASHSPGAKLVTGSSNRTDDGGAPAAPTHGEHGQRGPGQGQGQQGQGHGQPSHSQPTQQPPGAAQAVPTPGASAGPAYPGDTATPQQLAAWMGARAQAAGLPPELPVMAALTESGLRNLNYGDRDSVGFFQMRVGIWNEGSYTGYPDHPDLQIQWFIDHALAVKSQYPSLAANPSSWGEWVANVEQPAAAYRYRYQLQLGTAQALLHGAEAAPAAPVAPVAPAAPPVPVGQLALKVAMHFAGGSGHDAGASLQTGPQSAELVQYAYAQQGVQMPKVAAEQFDIGIPVAQDKLHPGDAVFFAQPNGYVDHVGLYVGNGRFVSAAPGGGAVKISSLADPGFPGKYVGARRYTAEALGNPSSYARSMPTIKQ